MLASYFDQFNMINMFFGCVTNSSFMVIFVVLLMMTFFSTSWLMPTSWQMIAELMYDHWVNLLSDSLGDKGSKYFPFIISLFFVLMLLNVLGLFPYVFTVGTHMVMTFGLSFSMVLAVTMLGMKNFKSNFFSLLMPQGAPMILAPLLVLMETASYLSSALSLGLSLAANLSAGHLLFSMLASFGFQMITNNLMMLSLFPMLMMMFMTILEIAVALMQAYVFCLLTSMYLEDTIKAH